MLATQRSSPAFPRCCSNRRSFATPVCPKRTQVAPDRSEVPFLRWFRGWQNACGRERGPAGQTAKERHFKCGVSFGRTTADTCEIRSKLPESAPLNPFCHVETGYLPQVKMIGAYEIPKIAVQTSIAYSGKAGIQVSGFGTPAGVGGEVGNGSACPVGCRDP